MREPLTRCTTTLGRWSAARPPLFWILSNVFLGFTLAVSALLTIGSACFDATKNKDAIGLIFGVGAFSISAEVCREVTKNPPWFLLSGLIASPAVLLTWYWRDQKRRDDHRLAQESGAAARYTKTAELLQSEHLMTRINGLFALWDLARESPSHRATVAHTLAAFLGTKTP